MRAEFRGTDTQPLLFQQLVGLVPSVRGPGHAAGHQPHGTGRRRLEIARRRSDRRLARSVDGADLRLDSRRATPGIRPAPGCSILANVHGRPSTGALRHRRPLVLRRTPRRGDDLDAVQGALPGNRRGVTCFGHLPPAAAGPGGGGRLLVLRRQPAQARRRVRTTARPDHRVALWPATRRRTASPAAREDES